MSDLRDRPTAQIIAFPAKPRPAEGQPACFRPDNSEVLTANFAVKPPPPLVVGGAWYHDAAIRENDPRQS